MPGPLKNSSFLKIKLQTCLCSFTLNYVLIRKANICIEKISSRRKHTKVVILAVELWDMVLFCRYFIFSTVKKYCCLFWAKSSVRQPPRVPSRIPRPSHCRVSTTVLPGTKPPARLCVSPRAGFCLLHSHRSQAPGAVLSHRPSFSLWTSVFPRFVAGHAIY